MFLMTGYTNEYLTLHEHLEECPQVFRQDSVTSCKSLYVLKHICICVCIHMYMLIIIIIFILLTLGNSVLTYLEMY